MFSFVISYFLPPINPCSSPNWPLVRWSWLFPFTAFYGLFLPFLSLFGRNGSSILELQFVFHLFTLSPLARNIFRNKNKIYGMRLRRRMIPIQSLVPGGSSLGARPTAAVLPWGSAELWWSLGQGEQVRHWEPHASALLPSVIPLHKSPEGWLFNCSTSLPLKFAFGDLQIQSYIWLLCLRIFYFYFSEIAALILINCLW